MVEHEAHVVARLVRVVQVDEELRLDLVQHVALDAHRLLHLAHLV